MLVNLTGRKLVSPDYVILFYIHVTTKGIPKSYGALFIGMVFDLYIPMLFLHHFLCPTFNL